MKKRATLEFTIDKSTDRHDIDTIFESINNSYEKEGKLRILCNYKDIPSVKEAISMFRHIGDKLKVMNYIDKYAIVTDKEWIKNLSDFLGKIWFGLEVKTFYVDETDDAKEWLQEGLAELKKNIEVIEYQDGEIIGFIADGKLTAMDYAIINQKLDSALEEGKKLNVIIDVSRLEGLTVKALVADLKTEVKYYKHINKAAIITEKNYKHVFDVLNFITPGVDIESFTWGDIDKVMSWFELKEV